MFIRLPNIIKKYNLKIRGVIHVGAHWGEEVEIYRGNGFRNCAFIEPCKDAYEHLLKATAGYDWAKTFNVACGSKIFETEIHVETRNNGQSNSILKPANHLKYYPDIKFYGKETITVVPLDTLGLNDGKYNMLNMDVQGYELEVLKGATETIKNIDVVYTEVNSEEIYEDCAKVDELDAFLSDFKRCEEEWTDRGWGDAIYIRKTLL